MTKRPPISESGLAAQLKEGTKNSHRRVEKVRFIRDFLKGYVNAESYRHLLVDFRTIYAALESGLRLNRRHAAVGPVTWPELVRVPALEADLAYFGVTDLPPSEAANEYATRLREISSTRPELLVAHAYVRYLGDLSGGQILRRFAARAFGLSGPDGLRFYDFPDLEDGKAAKDAFRQALDQLPLTETQQGAVVTEAVAAFEMNQRVFEALPGSGVTGAWRLLSGSGAAVREELSI